MDELFGRDEECGRLAAALEDARQGMSAVVVLRGGPGTGKSALLDHVRSTAAADFEIMRFDAVESETELGFAALHQLLRPHLAQLSTLPDPQRDALCQVFGLQERTSPPDRFLVGLASLGLLAARAENGPLLCLVDDAHWLDEESAAVLAFVARRLYADSVAMVFAVRDQTDRVDHLAGLPELAVTSLGAEAAGRLLESAVSGVLDPDVRSRVVVSTGGNPLALIEAARELSSDQLSGEAPLPEPIPLGRALERKYLREALALPPQTRTLLLASAADPTSDPNVLWRAGPELGFDATAAAAAEERHLLSIRETVKFRHPLIRSAVYYGAPLSQRARVHAALAEVAGDLGEVDLRAWHLAAAATDPDDVVATELERAAERIRDRGGWTGSSTLLARAASLTPDLPTRARRLLAAAEASAVAGSPGRAQALLDEAAAHREDRRYTGVLQRVQARIHRLMGAPAAATYSLLAAARELGSVDIRLARDILVEALVQAQISGSLAPQGASRLSVAETVRSLPLPAGTPATTGDAVLEADTAVHLEGLGGAGPRLQQAIEAVRREESTDPELFQWLAAACSHATILGDDIALHELAWRLEAEARRQGAVIPMALALSHTALSELIAGRIAESERLFDQSAALEEARGSQLYLGALLVAAWRGRFEEARALTEAVQEHAARTGQGYQLIFYDYARSVIELSQGRYHEAYLSLEDKIGDTCQVKFALVDMVEAAARCGKDDEATRLLERLSHLADRSPVPGLLGDLARAQALTTADPSAAEELYLRAIRHHENTRGPSRRARSHQLYGEWLRRERRTKEARYELRIAYELFDGMGAQGYAARTAQELYAAGDPVQSRGDAHGGGSRLTPQEARVARLAAGGATNAEIAAQLYLSVHTVDYHLRKVFRKLDVHSRRELADRRDRITSA
ncbi:AAA family ATPase [Actinoallomurus purpureus]|uniref:ATP-binding protein n=1 Tax=Actinoallomurus purpureus TaxID=478114 RepID=UPI002092ACB3|nr:LuxR family transcriptional regulator [Actinoallomurus purpureus]MCO6003872.1 AAA family ATPase [Actinoallomurus purpureus]